jgi:hypothetical protein
MSYGQQPITEEEIFRDYVYRCSLLTAEQKLKKMGEMRDFFIKYKIKDKDEKYSKN